MKEAMLLTMLLMGYHVLQHKTSSQMQVRVIMLQLQKVLIHVKSVKDNWEETQQ